MSYDVLVAPDLLHQVGRIVADRASAHRYAIITDSNLVDSHAAAVLSEISQVGDVSLFSFPAGEANKTRATWSRLTDEILAAGFGRDSAIVGVGGGVVGDMAGFVAATYMRGIPVIQIPTTLLAMIDSSIGGKTGVDVSAGKNLVGAFHQPAVVIEDPAVLATLPPNEIRNGLAEAIKHGAIADEEYFTHLAQNSTISAGPLMTDLVARSVRIKAAVVAEDELEGGKRAILNFGHTVGHAVELATEFSVQHGEAVAIGMIAESKIGEELGVTSRGTTDRIIDALIGAGLPTSIPPQINAADLIELMKTDKKARAGTVRFSLLKRVGESALADVSNWTHNVPEALLTNYLAGS